MAVPLPGLVETMEEVRSAAVVADESGGILWFNRAFEQAVGGTAAEITGGRVEVVRRNGESAPVPGGGRSAGRLATDAERIDLRCCRAGGENLLADFHRLPITDPSGLPHGFLALKLESGATEQSEEELRYNLRQQELMAEIALSLNRYSDFSQSVHLVMRALLQHTQVSRIYIFEDVEGGLACSNTFEACNTGIEPQIEKLSHLPYSVVPYWEKMLRERGMVFSENISELPEDVRAVLEPQQIKSILVYPLHVNGEKFGFIGFDECVVHKHWRRSDLELLRAVSGIIGNAYERELARKSLVRKNEELKKINSELDSFVYSISHDLRSPLLSIKGILSLVLKLAPLDEKARGLLGRAEGSVNRLDETIQEILEYSRNSRLGLDKEWVEMERLVDDIFADLRYAAPRNFEFRRKISSRAARIFTDKSRLSTVLKNVVGNAIKYHGRDRERPMVEVVSCVSDGFLAVTVTDNGEGIGAAHLPKVFDMFYRASTSSPGSGLGLYICREIIQKMDGRIDLESVPGRGTVVEIRIPLENV